MLCYIVLYTYPIDKCKLGGLCVHIVPCFITPLKNIWQIPEMTNLSAKHHPNRGYTAKLPTNVYVQTLLLFVRSINSF